MVSVGLSLKPSNLPEKTLAFTNKCYVSQSDLQQLCPSGGAHIYIEVKSCVFTVEAHKAMEPGTIAFNKVQREFARIGLNQEVFVKQFPVPKSFDLGTCKLEVDFFLKPAPDAARLEVRDEDLDSIMRKNFEQQILSVGQAIAVDYNGTLLKFEVRGLMPPDLGDGAAVKKVNAGLLASLTELDFQQGPSGKLHVLSNKLQQRNIFRPDFNFEDLGIGGLSKQFGDIFRRAFAARVFPPHMIRDLGVSHVRGMLLHGPPGTGKTLIARKLAKFLKAAEPKVVNGPEILNKYVGQAEENIRNLFADAEKDEKTLGENSPLHVVIFDEIDSICKSRGSTRDGTGVHDSIVNQLLSKIDGVDSLNNILLIGMTNRKDLIDEALLRPGRLEIHVEISLPDEHGRVEILNIHTKSMRDKGYLEKEVSIADIASRTKNFSGAELEGLIRSATSYAMNRKVSFTDLSIKEGDFQVCREDFDLALDEVKPAFGQHTDDFEKCIPNGIQLFSDEFNHTMGSCMSILDQLRGSTHTPLMSMLLHGDKGSGKTALSAHLAQGSDYPYVRRIASDRFVGFSEQAKISAIAKIFEDAYKSDLSCIVLDDIERLVDFVRVGPRFSTPVLQALMALLKKPPPKENSRLLVIGTSTDAQFLEEVELLHSFNVSMAIPVLSQPAHYKVVLESLPGFTPPAVQEICGGLAGQSIGIKTLLLVAEMAVQRENPVQFGVFKECLGQCGIAV
ncbi:unnamed protein product [Effrenium voratum]|uniref:Vesicle-fusing ATPase n=1 Tax=Effrenium voratum TaxID=2562239 RepID=A0AA36N002_9DINO|nr:unnamed protein product [Effrenium voratum]CAJ1460219.1 unnamed protein product [Effrenium voratum]